LRDTKHNEAYTVLDLHLFRERQSEPPWPYLHGLLHQGPSRAIRQASHCRQVHTQGPRVPMSPYYTYTPLEQALTGLGGLPVVHLRRIKELTMPATARDAFSHNGAASDSRNDCRRSYYHSDWFRRSSSAAPRCLHTLRRGRPEIAPRSPRDRPSVPSHSPPARETGQPRGDLGATSGRSRCDLGVSGAPQIVEAPLQLRIEIAAARVAAAAARVAARSARGPWWSQPC
jgi:hypothetical protein